VSKQDNPQLATGAFAEESRAQRNEAEGENMEPMEIQAKATIAAALIVSRAVEVPTIPTSGDWSQDSAAIRLRDLTDYVYQMITSPRSR
jgi:hypothetical protein